MIGEGKEIIMTIEIIIGKRKKEALVNFKLKKEMNSRKKSLLKLKKNQGKKVKFNFNF